VGIRVQVHGDLVGGDNIVDELAVAGADLQDRAVARDEALKELAA
jgi:hypothetical protein